MSANISGSGRPAGSGLTKTIGGVEYYFSPIGVGDFGDMFNYAQDQLNKLKPNLIKLLGEAEIYKNFPKEVADKLLKEALEESKKPSLVSQEECGEYINSPGGWPIIFLVSLKKKQPGTTMASISEMLNHFNGKEEIEELISMIETMSGLDEAAKNFSGRQPAARKTRSKRRTRSK